MNLYKFKLNKNIISSLASVIFQDLISYMWLVATILSSADIEHLHHCRTFFLDSPVVERHHPNNICCIYVQSILGFTVKCQELHPPPLIRDHAGCPGLWWWGPWTELGGGGSGEVECRWGRGVESRGGRFSSRGSSLSALRPFL